MKVSLLKSDFFSALHSLYPQEELQSFFSLLAEHILKMTRLETTLQSEKELTEEEVLKFSNAMDRLKKFEPIQYIIGETEFFDLLFTVNKHTLIPRPETEALVDWIIQDVNSQHPTPGTLLDIGTGSGCIAIALAHHLPQTRISAIDISSEALVVASENAIRNKVQVDLKRQDVLELTALPKQFDIIVSNPPYVREQEKAAMQKNVLQHEPDIALFVSNSDPLLFYRKISRLAKTGLNPGGILYFEINEYLSKEMETLLREVGFKQIEVKQDIFGRDRMIKAYNHA